MDFPNVFDSVRLVLAGTPIGNVGDASPRLVETLQEAEIIACEDTRRLRDLARRLGVKLEAQLVAYHEHNEAELTPTLITKAAAGTKIAQVSDAGMPGISDPGFRLARAAGEAGLPFTVLPGPSAFLLALVASGLPTDDFRFLGFLPRKTGALEQVLQSLVSACPTMIFLESPRRAIETLRALEGAFGGNRPAALARELTKTHEEVLRGTLGSIAQTLSDRGEVLGEIVIVVSGARAESSDLTAELKKMDQLVQSGVRSKTAAKIIGEWFDVSAHALYEAYLEAST